MWDYDAESHTRYFASVVSRDRNVDRPNIRDVQPDQQVILKVVSLRYSMERNPLQCLSRYRGIAVLRINQVPVARCRLGQEGEHHVAEYSVLRHPLEAL